MPNINDFYDFNNSTNGGSNGGGCFPWKIILILVIIYGIFTLISKCAC